MIWEVILVLFVLAYLGRWAASGWQGRGGNQLEAQHTAELARLRDEMDQLTATVVRLQDEQSFTTRLLTESGRGPAAALPGPDAAPDVPTTNPEKP
jgi:cell division protein FtsB